MHLLFLKRQFQYLKNKLFQNKFIKIIGFTLSYFLYYKLNSG